MEKFSQCFSDLPDPRADNSQHDLTEILFIALLATLCGAQTCCDIALFAKTKETLLRTVLELAHGVPIHDTFSRVFRMLDPKAFEKAFRRFMRAFAEATEGVVALDGKALRRAYEGGKSHMPPIMVTAWSAQTRMALANVLAAGNNEAAAALQLVGLLTLKGCVVTADALHCHRAMAAGDRRAGRRLRARGQGQPACFAARCAGRRCGGNAHRARARTVSVDDRHGRHETRVAVVAPAGDMAERHAFPVCKPLPRSRAERSPRQHRRALFSAVAPLPAAGSCCASFVNIGASKTACIGRSMSCSTKTSRAAARTMHRPTSPSCAASLSTSRVPIPTPKPPSVASSNVQDGTKLSFSRCCATCDSPGGVRGRTLLGARIDGAGTRVVLLPPQYVKPYVQRGKNDAADASAICEAMSRPRIRLVPVKTAEQQAALMLVGVRDQLIARRTQLSNMIRGYAAEFGITAARGLDKIEPLLARIATDPGVPELAKELFTTLAEEYAELKPKLRRTEAQLLAWHRQNEPSRRLAQVPAIGLIGASLLVMKVPDPRAFRTGRDFAAWLGLPEGSLHRRQAAPRGHHASRR